MLKLMVPILCLGPLNVLAASEGCEGSESIEDALGCLQTEVEKADSAMMQYLGAIKERHAAGKIPWTSLAAIESSQDLWLRRRESRCRRPELLPRDEAKLAAEYLYCRSQVTRERTRELWEKYLSPSDGALPELPEHGR